MGLSAVHRIDAARIAHVIKHLYLDAGMIYGAKVRADFARVGAYKPELKSRGAIGFSQRMHDLIMQYFSVDILTTSEGITQTTRELITQVFNNAYLTGLSINDIVNKLKDTELSKIRARMIARTETNSSANRATLMVANDTGLLYNKTWLATSDARTRDDHVHIDGHTVGMNDYFIVGGFEMQSPGDKGGKDGRPLVDPRETVNCRCRVTIKAIRDSRGRLVRA